MTQLKPTFGKTMTDTAALASAIGVDASAIGGPHAPQEVNCGSNFFIVPLATRKAVDAAVLDRAKADAAFAAAGIQRRGIYVFTNEPGSDTATAYTRCSEPAAPRTPAPDRRRTGGVLHGAAPLRSAGTRRLDRDARRACS
jgi:predicted PhzF superfamily epimerase YddE/YHI9